MNYYLQNIYLGLICMKVTKFMQANNVLFSKNMDNA